MAEPVYRRVVVKLSGEYLAGAQSFGIDQPTVDRIAGDLIAAQKLGSEIAVVVGGGNIVRNTDVTKDGGFVLANSLTNEVTLVRIAK